MRNLEFLEYNLEYAQAVADMWNDSEESWGGYDRLKTRDDIIEEEEISGNLKVFLALDNKNVVGYCSFSEYKEENNVAYIPMLNVCPDYQGQKIGKKLVINAVEKAINENWSRIDLYTWAGNMKAIPLYKKCGFFWEERDDITHLMNFMPVILNTEVLKKYFKTVDWYKNSIRNIEIVPDGRKENGFEFFEYTWKKDDVNLRVELCKNGRGIRLIETNDYEISIIAEDNELVVGNKYNVIYHIVNKSGDKLAIDIEGINDKNIKFNFKRSINVEREEFIYGEFYLENIDKELSQFEAYPCILSKAMINEEELVLKLGINPRKPITIDLIIPQNPIYLGVESIGYLNIENRFNENIELYIKMEDTEDINFLNKNIYINMSKREKNSIEIRYILNKHHYFSKDIKVRIKIGDEVLHDKFNLSYIFKGTQGVFYGETKSSWNIISGKTSVVLNKFNNEIIIDNLEKVPLEKFRILSPRLGYPLSQEFSKKPAKKIKYFKKDENIILKAYYESKDFSNIEIESITKLYLNGIIEKYYKIFNMDTNETKNDIYISESFIFNLGNSYIPFNNNVVCINGDYGTNLDYWNTKNISENWLFSEEKNITYGVSWPEDCRIKFNEWYMSIDNNLGRIKGNESITTKPIIFACGVYSEWKAFREFVIKKYELNDIKLVEHLDVTINDGNPFINNEFKICIVDNKSSTFNGILSVDSFNKSFNFIKKAYKSEEQIREDRFNIKLNNKNIMDVVELNIDFEATQMKRRKAIFKIGDVKVNKRIINQNGIDIYIVENGILTMKVAPEFSNSLYSLEYNGKEWLDSDFPKVSTRSWWNPWTGGIICSPGEPNALQNTDIFEGLNEEKNAKFIEVKDNHGNVWSGIVLNIKIKNNKKYNGLEINQYFLTMSKLPVIFCTSEVVQNSGKYLKNQDFVTTMFIKSDENLKESYFISENNYGDEIKYKAGSVQMCIYDNECIMYGGNSRKDKLQIYSPKSLSLDGYLDIKTNGCFVRNRINLANNHNSFLPNIFMIFTDKYISKRSLIELESINLNNINIIK